MRQDQRLINPPLPESSSTPSRFLGRGVEIPDDLLQEASRRLGLISLLGVVLWTVGMVLDHVALRALRPAGDPYWRQFHIPDLIAIGGVVTSLALYFYSRVTTRPPRTLLDLGL